MRSLAVALLAFISFGTAQNAPYPDCEPSMTCFQISPYPSLPGELIFDCAAINASGPSKGNVYLMHGNDGPRSKGMWALTMQSLAAHGYNSLACDQRGFSPGASPKDPAAYNYDLLVEDIVRITEAYFGKGAKFHAVAHDQGARVGWHALALGPGRERYLSYSAMSEAHSDAFSDALYGPNPDPKQQLHFQYLRQFTLPNMSVLAYKENIWHILCQAAKQYDTPEACQPAIWWYPGAVTSGNLAVQPFNGSFGRIGQQIGIPGSYVIEHTPYPLEGVPQRTKVGMVTEVPVQYICGSSDYADLCTDRFRDGTAALVKTFNYLRLETCGHALCSPAKCPEYQTVIDGVVGWIEKHTPNSSRPLL